MLLRWKKTVFVMFLICESKQRVESKVKHTFLTSATVDVMKPGMEKLRWEVLLSGWGSNFRVNV